MISSQSYLVRAIYDWVLDNNFTPYIMVDTSTKDVSVPEAYIRDFKIILNINPSAVDSFAITENEITFSARFSGEQVNLYIPIPAVKAIYAKEIESGMMFNDQGLGVMFSQDAGDDFPSPPDGGNKPKSASKSNKPSLRVVK